jgi:hypothetical protein
VHAQWFVFVSGVVHPLHELEYSSYWYYLLKEIKTEFCVVCDGTLFTINPENQCGHHVVTLHSTDGNHI